MRVLCTIKLEPFPSKLDRELNSGKLFGFIVLIFYFINLSKTTVSINDENKATIKVFKSAKP